MKDQKKNNNYDNDPYRVEATEDFSTCSSMDCTGLIPTPPQSNAEEEAYEELYPYLPEAAAGKHEDSFS